MIDEIIKLAQRTEAQRNPNDYEADGLLYCGNCHTPKRCRIQLEGRAMIVGCMCSCENQKWEEQQVADRLNQEQIRIKALRMAGISDKSLRKWNFDTAKNTKLIQKCRQYAEKWDAARAENLGLIFWGSPGGGKTYAAACIANYLIDRGVPAMITSFPRILAAGWDERREFMHAASRFPLLVIDDLGVERKSPYALEAVYSVVDERYKSGKPLIVTTNLTLGQLKEPENIEYCRIYDRILEMCVPVQVETAEAYRKNAAVRKVRSVKSIFAGEGQG